MVCPTRNCTANPGNVNAATVLAATRDYHTSIGLSPAIYQLDTWWFLQQADVRAGGSLDCVDWVPRADLFPDGLPAVTQHGVGGTPLLLYSWGYIPPARGGLITNFT